MSPKRGRETITSAIGTSKTTDSYRILSIDGGGIRGLIPARLIEHLESRLSERTGQQRRMADYFHMFAGTSTGGLIALGLTAARSPGSRLPRLSGADLATLYRIDGPKIFGDRLRRLWTLDGWIAPRHSSRILEDALSERFGEETSLADALREVVVTSYDMHGSGEAGRPGPYFFKRRLAQQFPDRDLPIVEVGISTSSAPTFFPSYGLGDRALIDGGVFAANPTVAGLIEALKLRAGGDPAADQNLLVVSLGTGQHEVGYEQRRVRRWGRLQWILPRGGEPALISAFLDGQSDAADHWARVLLDMELDDAMLSPMEPGREQRYFRFQVTLERGLGLDDARAASLDALDRAAAELIADGADNGLEKLVDRLVELGPLPPESPFVAPAR